ncbi:hypothetical protein NDU88_005003 [Pleurodeles waltl]|uniref:Protein TALPID3 n=1 Tax=Pleurodeles waltl TaxID=8319 RepID=A0AAV7N005_PLEWA|nr:hypothetical protein NDU88_005003 [Pleurodeles waltl]
MALSGSDVSLVSTDSSTAGDVLIRSTSVERSLAGKKQWTPHERQQETPRTSYIPPALSANKPWGRRISPGTPQAETNCEQHPLPEKMDSYLLLNEANLNIDSKRSPGPGPLLKEKSSKKENSKREGNICISQYATGQKETLRACLKQRVPETSVNKEVRVQLLQDIAAEESKKGDNDERQAHRDLDSAGIIAAATAAAIATAAPLLKAQSDLDAKIGSVSELICKLQADQLSSKMTDQQVKKMAQIEDGQQYRDRISQLEKQLGRLTEQRMQYIENLQKQQMEIQSRFISSAVNTSGVQRVCTHAICPNPSNELAKPGSQQMINHPDKDVFPVTRASTNVNSNQLVDSDHSKRKSPLETPAPRRFPPVPMSKDVHVPFQNQLLTLKENVDGSNVEKGRFLEQILRNQESPASQPAFGEKTPVTITKLSKNSSVTLPSDPEASAEQGFQGIKHFRPTGSSAVQKANDVLQDISQLKKDMQTMLQTKDTLHRTMIPEHHYFGQSSLLQKSKAPKSMFEDAERILREVKNDKKVLEDNLEAIIRAKDGSAVYSLISALTTNGDAVEEIRIKSEVDAWIKDISTEIQEEMMRKDYDSVKQNTSYQDMALKKSSQNIKRTKDNLARGNRSLPRTIEDAKKPLPANSVRAFPKQSEDISTRANVKSQLQKKDVKPKASRIAGEVDNPTEEHLTQLYGKPIYQSHRSTLKKGPYLRFTSPSPKSKPQRPKVVECIRGVKLKSARTQTRSSPLKTLMAGPKPRYILSQLQQENQYAFSPSREMPVFSGPLEGHLIPMAIPLGQSQMDVAAPHPASVVVMRQHPVTVTTTVPPSLPTSQPKVQKPKVAVIEMKSEKRDPPKLSVQVLPSVDIDSILSDSTDGNMPSPEVIQSPVLAETVPQAPTHIEQEEDYIAFPGTDFIDVTDIPQDQEKEEDEMPEEVLEYNGWSEPVISKYNGIPFPPTAPAPHPTSDVLNDIIERKETLENRLISWVEQEIMARIISEMYPAQRETVPNVSVSDSEESGGVSSDIVETAGAEGLQLFVDTGVPVDSELIRQYVNEAVAETVAVMLGEREERKVQSGAPSTQDVVDTSTRTPLATPQCTPPRTPSPAEIVELHVTTPILSPRSSVSEDEIPKRKSPIQAETKSLDAQILVGTPTVTPVSTPPRVVTPVPLPEEQVTDSIRMPSPPRQSPWEDVELPLEEENPTSVKEEELHPKPLIMSVAQEEEPASPVSIVYSDRGQSPVSLPSEEQKPSPVPPPSCSPSTAESSLTVSVTETETVDQPISEGEVLYSYGQLVAARALAEGGMMFSNLNGSLSSTLRDAHDMDYDPPSEGQVIHRPHQRHHRDPVLSLLVKLNQAPITSNQVIYNPEISDDEHSSGELSEGQRPRFTAGAESVMLGHPLCRDHPVATDRATVHRIRPSSPGQLNGDPGTVLGESATSLGPLSLGELEVNAETSQQPPQAEDMNASPTAVKDVSQKTPEILLADPKPAPARIIHVGVKEEATEHQGAHADLDRTHIEPSVYLTSLLSEESSEPPLGLQTTPGKMSVTLPSMIEEDPPDSIESLHMHDDSSGADTF